MRAGILYAAVLATVLAAPSFAAEVTIKNFAGTVTLTQGDLELDVIKRGEKGDLDVDESGSTLIIDGGLTRTERNKACNGGGWSWDLDFNGKRSQHDSRLEDYPEIEIAVPAGADLIIRDSHVALDGDVELGTADLQLSGCFDARLGVIETLDLELSGSGDVDIDKVDYATIEKSGAGDIDIKTAGSFRLEQSGAGDIEVGFVTDSVQIDKSGSGDIEFDRVDGPVSIHKSGSGDIEIKSGTVTEVEIHNSGSGDVDIRTPVEDAQVHASGSGDIYIESVSGTLYEQVSGAADLNLGDD